MSRLHLFGRLRYSYTAPAVSPAGQTFGAARLLGGNFWGVVDYKKDYPFADLVLTSRGFKTLNNWGGAATPDTTLNAQGWPTTDFSIYFLGKGTPKDAGVYTGTFTGQVASITKPFGNGTLSAVSYNAGTNTSTFTVTASASIDQIGLNFTGLSSDFANLKFMAPGYAGSSAFYRTEFLNHIASASTLRFMDWQLTNDSTDTTWDTSLAGQGSHRTRYKHSLDAAIDLCNATSKDCYVCVPSQFTDAAITAFVQRLAARLNSGLKAYVEFSNEVWYFYFGQTRLTMLDVKAAASVRSGSAQITSCARVSNVATMALTEPHGKTGTFPAVVMGLTGLNADESSLTGKLVTCTVTGANTFTFPSVGADASAAIAINDNTAVFLTPSSQWTRPLTAFGSGAYPSIYEAHRRYLVDRARVIQAAIEAAGLQARTRTMLSYQTGATVAQEMLSYATEQYGTASWLTLTPANYAFVSAGAVGVTDAASCLAQLDSYRPTLRQAQWQLANCLASYGIPLIAYEGGPHTSENPDATKALAIRDAHRSDGMRTFIKSMIQDWRNMGGQLFCYYTYGAGPAWGTPNSNDSWPMMDTGGIDYPSTAPKYLAMVETASASADPVPVDGVTSGEIQLANAWPFALSTNSASQGNKMVSAGWGCPPKMSINVCRVDAGPVTLTVNAGSQSTSDWISIEVNGVEVATQVAFPASINPFITPAPAVWSGTVAMNAGMNIVSLKLKPATRGGLVGLRSIVVS